jgi:hypothetical protein
VRLEPELLKLNVGLLEMLRLDRWIDTATSEVTFGGIMWNPDVQILASWKLKWMITPGGSFARAQIGVHSAPVGMASFSSRRFGENLVLLLCFCYQLLLLASSVRNFIRDHKAWKEGNMEDQRSWFEFIFSAFYIFWHIFYLTYQIDLFCVMDHDEGFNLLDDRHLLGA